MGRGGLVRTVWMMGMVLLLAGTAAASAPHDLTEGELRYAMTLHNGMAAYVKRNGMPDLAVSRFLSDKPPWDKNEVVLYYFDAHKEISWARAVILGEPTIHLERFERPISDAEIEQLRPRAGHYGSGAVAVASNPGDPTERAEAAAQRAEAAAGRVESAADAADRAADRAEAIANKTERSFHKSLKK